MVNDAFIPWDLEDIPSAEMRRDERQARELSMDAATLEPGGGNLHGV